MCYFKEIDHICDYNCFEVNPFPVPSNNVSNPKHPLRLTVEDIQIIKSGRWLNYQIIDCYLQLLKDNVCENNSVLMISSISISQHLQS